MTRRNFFSSFQKRILTTALTSSALTKASGLHLLHDFLMNEEEVSTTDLGNIRSVFNLSRKYIFMSALLISSHPRPVRAAIERYRKLLDEENAPYLQNKNSDKQQEVRDAAAAYLNTSADFIALTESTTMGTSIVYQGFDIKAGEEIIVARDDYYSTYQSIQWKTVRSGAKMREVELYEDSLYMKAEDPVKTLIDAITPNTRIIALTWVHSGTGVKLPVKKISDAVREINALRADDEYIFIIVDGVHGLGVENITIADLGCDVFIAGCHKWLFGPRGTGILWGNKKAWSRIYPIIPSFLDSRSWMAWQNDEDPPFNNAELMSPGGFKSFEHLWSVKEAFEFHMKIGKKKIAECTHRFAGKIKHHLYEMDHITVRTPKNDMLSSGIVCFDVEGMNAWEAAEKLYEKKIIASVSPYASRHIRLTPAIYNSMEEVQTVINAVKELK